ncbi:MAG: DNA polymerase II large subunit [Thermoplasmata archaeon]|nr:DNA polymerase II large subunit [Thermoplasmata archaeon]
MKGYLNALKEGLNRAYSVAMKARSKGFDPALEVEIPFAEDVAGRVEKLVGPPGVADLIRKLGEEIPEREMLSIEVSRRVAREIYEESGDKRRALDQAVRTGLAILTEGVLVAPLEGIDHVKISRNSDGSEYADMFFSGPIRAAGGTAQAMSVLLGDVVRKELGLGRYVPTEDEIDRYIEEFQLYRNLQYRPSNEEIRFVIKNCPVCINGEGTEKEEVQGHRDLPRVPTNKVRSGVCLVIAEGLLQKSAKLLKITRNLGLKDWEFLSQLKKKGKVEEKEEVVDELEEILEDDVEVEVKSDGKEMKYISDLIMGRPVFSHPSRPGGFRLRYGRARTGGLAAIAIHPATMEILEEFTAVGTQIKTEKPGKAGVVTPCDTIDGPLVLLKNGDFVKINSLKEAQELKDSVERVVDLGDILIPVGEFLENNHPLLPGVYTREWWEWEVREALYLNEKNMKKEESPYREVLRVSDKLKVFEAEERERLLKEMGVPKDEDGKKKFEERLEGAVKKRLSEHSKEVYRRLKDLDATLQKYEIPKVRGFDDAYKVSKELGVPLHPDYTLLWHDLKPENIVKLRKYLIEEGRVEEGELHIPKRDDIKEYLLILGALHRERGGEIVLTELSQALYVPLGLKKNGDGLEPIDELPEGWREMDPLSLVSQLSGVKIRGRAPTRIGARMGRPEKAAMRKMKPPVHGLFPVGTEGGPQRLVQNSAEKGRAYVNAKRRKCVRCGSIEIYLTCRRCGGRTRPLPDIQENGRRRENWPLDIKEEFQRALKKLGKGITEVPKVKGVKGLSSADKMPERLEKAILRSIHEVYVFKDGTCRYDMTDIPITHFRPREIGTDIETLRRLGYTRDIEGRPLEREDQILEIKPQDIIINRGGGDYLMKVAQFVDDVLVKLYGMEPFYNVNKPEDLIGHLLLGLAPHTSAGVLVRLIGFTEIQGCLAHPFFHASKRRNCDGDEDAVMLLLDALLNFSRSFLPESRGGKMDAPLVVSTIIKPEEIDKEAHNVDVGWRYPLDFYYLTTLSPSLDNYQSYLSLRMETVKSRLGTERALEGFGFTHDTRDINKAPVSSAYKRLSNMEEKMKLQFSLEERIRAVDENDVAERILSTHLIPDIMGNIRSFGTQTFRCTKCQKTYRRLPLTGRCTNRIGNKICGNPLVLTVHEGNIKKYIDIMKELSEGYRVRGYTRERVRIHMQTLDSLFKYTTNSKKKRGKTPQKVVKSLEAFL